MRKRIPLLMGLLSVLTLVGARLAWADDDDDEQESGRPRVSRRVPLLPKHYGGDASLDAASVKKLTTWLTANAAPSRSMPHRPPQDRITQSAWFVHQHDEISASVWKRPSIKSAANCVACHAGAEQGDFNEHRVRIPR